MIVNITHRWLNSVLVSTEAESLKAAIEIAVLDGADLRWADHRPITTVGEVSRQYVLYLPISVIDGIKRAAHDLGCEPKILARRWIEERLAASDSDANILSAIRQDACDELPTT